VHYTTKGDGPHRTILLHGFLGSGRNLRSFADQWSKRDPSRTIYLCDMLGHGDSPPLPEHPTLFSLVPPIVELMGTGPVTLVGHSLGGRAALVAANEREATQVVLLDISPAPIADRNAGIEQVLKAFLAAPDHAVSRDEMRTALTGNGLSVPMADWLLMNLEADADNTLRWAVDRQALATLGANTRGDDLWSYAEKIGRKLKVIYGTSSSFVTPQDAERLTKLGADVRPIQGASHYLHVDALPALLDNV